MKNKLLVLTYCVVSLAMTGSVWAQENQGVSNSNPVSNPAVVPGGSVKSSARVLFSTIIIRSEYNCLIRDFKKGVLAASADYKTLTSDANFSGSIADVEENARPKPAGVTVTILPWINNVGVKVDGARFHGEMPNGDLTSNYSAINTWLTGANGAEPRGKGNKKHRFNKIGEVIKKTYEVHFEATRSPQNGPVEAGTYKSLVTFTCE